MQPKRFSEYTPITETDGNEILPIVKDGENATVESKNLPVSTATQTALDGKVSESGDTMTGPLQIKAPGALDISSLPLGRSGAANTGLNLIGSFQGGEDSGAGTDTTARLNIYAYQRAQTGSFGEGIRHFMMRGDAKAMITWYIAKAGYDATTRLPNESLGYMPAWWIGAHYEANDHDGYHNHGSIEVPDASGALQTRLEIPFVDQATWTPGTPFGVAITNIRTNLADFSVRASSGVLRVGGGNAYNKDILLSASSDRTSSGERWKIRADNTTESGSNAGTDFNIRRYADDGSFMATALFIRRSDGNIILGASTALSARLSAVWSTDGHHGFYAQPSASVGNGAAFASAMQSAAAVAGDHRVIGDATARYRVYVDGKLEWGDGGAGGRDTNLYRSAANTLKTDDSLIIGGASTVFDDPASGASLTVDFNSGTLRLFSGGATHVYIGDTGGYLDFAPSAASGAFKFTYDRVTATSGSLFRVTSSGGLTGSVGASRQYGMAIDPVINQSSTGAYTALYINPTETAIGSGTNYLADFSVGGTRKASITTAGKIDGTAFSVAGANGASGSFTSNDGKTITVTNGLITSIV